ncbi:unnamed protein product [Cylindrotheca closterium]|uniref:ETS domain-containing protein n=1 Tax=Cylindrotheca closterium TaxID=2856 RepID=A0AAD2CFB3_9STRA|nr:unnamed protein product [Cylindrotheca closterium]
MPLFPYKLHELLTEMQSNDRLSSIISWTQSGNAFKIHEPLLFEEILLQKYFPRQTQINSFKRQLLYYGYDNLGNGIFAHPCFLKDKRHLCGQINHTNPTKSQREGKALILSRRIRGKRAKHALRQRLEVPATSTKASTTITKKEEAERSIAGAAALDSRDHSPTSVTTSPAVPTTLSLATFSPGVIPMALASNGRLGGSQQSSMDTMPFHSPREMPNQYWSRLKTFKAPLTRMVSSDFAKEAKHLPGTAAGVSMFPPLNDESTLDLTREEWIKSWYRHHQ